MNITEALKFAEKKKRNAHRNLDFAMAKPNATEDEILGVRRNFEFWKFTVNLFRREIGWNPTDES